MCSNVDREWSDREKFLVSAFANTFGWGVVASFAFIGWLAGDLELDFASQAELCVITWVAIGLIGLIWTAATHAMWIQVAPLLCPTADRRRVRTAFVIPLLISAQVFGIAYFAAFD